MEDKTQEAHSVHIEIYGEKRKGAHALNARKMAGASISINYSLEVLGKDKNEKAT